MSPIVDAGAHDHADARAVEREPHGDADDDGGDEDDQAHHRILQVDRLARGFDRGDERQLDRADQRARRLDLVEIAAEGPQHQVGEHDRQPDRHHGLAQILPLDAAEDEDLQGDADQRHDDEGGDEAQQPRSGRDAHRVADVAAEQIERAVGEIDVAHQPEDQGEAARHQEIQAAERDAVEDRAEEHFLLAEGVLQSRGPGGEDQPQRHPDRDQDDEGPHRMAFDELSHARRPRRVNVPTPAGAGPSPDTRSLGRPEPGTPACWTPYWPLSSRGASRPIRRPLAAILAVCAART